MHIIYRLFIIYSYTLHIIHNIMRIYAYITRGKRKLQYCIARPGIAVIIVYRVRVVFVLYI